MAESSFNPMLTGLASGLFSWIADLLLYPIDTIATRLKGTKTKSLVRTPTFIKESILKEGKGLYRGVALTFPHSFLPTVIYIYLYQNLLHYSSKLVHRYQLQKEIKLVFPFFASALAEGVALILELPFDTVRTRIQMNLSEYQYSSALVGLKEIYEREGLLRFYKSTKVDLYQGRYTWLQKQSTQPASFSFTRCQTTSTVMLRTRSSSHLQYQHAWQP